MIIGDTAIDRYEAIKPSQFRVLTRMTIEQNVSEGGYLEIALEIELRSEDESEHRRLALSFAGVRNLNFRPWISPIRFSPLQICLITDLQWEGVSYKVFEGEQDTEFSFLSREFEVELREPV